MLSDPSMKIIDEQFHIRNPREPGLAIHALYVLDRTGRVYYRKVGGRRPLSLELKAAVDWHRTKAASPGPAPSKPTG